MTLLIAWHQNVKQSAPISLPQFMGHIGNTAQSLPAWLSPRHLGHNKAEVVLEMLRVSGGPGGWAPAAHTARLASELGLQHQQWVEAQHAHIQVDLMLILYREQSWWKLVHTTLLTRKPLK